MTKPAYTIWIGTNSVRGSQGIYTVTADQDTLAMHIVHTQDAYNTGAIAYDPTSRRLFAVSEGMVFDGKASGGVTSYAVDAGGRLTPLGKTCTLGQRPCSIAADPQGENVYTANFFGGSLSMIPVEPDGTLRPVRKLITDPIQPGWLHAMHCVGVLDEGKTVAALSVSRSSLLLYDAQSGAELCSYCFGEKVFVRSLAAWGAYIYVLIQDPGYVYVLKREGRNLIQQQAALMQPPPPDFYGSSALRVTPNGRFLLAGARRTNTIAVFRIGEDGGLEQTDAVHLPGETPRDFAVSPDGAIVVTALQASDELCIHRIDEQRGTLVLEQTGLKIPSPAAVAIRKEAV